MIRVVLAEDHEILRQTLRDSLARANDIKIEGEARDGAEAVAMAAALRPDVVLMDVRMPRMGGVDATRLLKRVAGYDVKVVALSSSFDPEFVAPMKSVGASAYLLKSDRIETIVDVIRRVHRGEDVSWQRHRDAAQRRTSPHFNKHRGDTY